MVTINFRSTIIWSMPSWSKATISAPSRSSCRAMCMRRSDDGNDKAGLAEIETALDEIISLANNPN